MRLLCSKNLALEEFNDKRLPPYAILSHTWGEGEVSFQDLEDGGAPEKPGYQKILRCCEEAARDGFSYTWVDTCCIDKTSSSELSEAINSMYRWYQGAGVCYVYLSDVSKVTAVQASLPEIESALSRSRWFTRGWTLQELIAPPSLIFFNDSWEEVGTKGSMQPLISRITGIQGEVLLGGSVENFSVAQRMSWAAKRYATRLEDLAYCLMGLFSVNMPMLYGEGERAFVRLQEEIMKVSDDDSLFAWKSPTWWTDDGGLLASSPAAFGESGKVVRSKARSSKPFTLTNKGIILQVPSRSGEDPNTRVALLDCECEVYLLPEARWISKFIGISLKQTLSADPQFVRDRTDIWITVDKAEESLFSPFEICIRAESQEKPSTIYNRCHFSTANLGEYGFSLEEIYHRDMVQGEDMVDSWIWPITTLPDDIVAVLRIHHILGDPFLVILKSKSGQILVNVKDIGEFNSLKQIFWSHDRDSSASSQGSFWKNAWKNEPDRVFWQLPHGVWEVCVAIKNQILSGRKVQTVVITGHPPRPTEDSMLATSARTRFKERAAQSKRATDQILNPGAWSLDRPWSIQPDQS